MEEGPPSRPPASRSWILGALLACLLTVLLTSWPVLDKPQLEPDDYRYLDLVQRLDQDFRGQLGKASVVENRWDHLWWMDAEKKVRFFRPTVVLSYWLDFKMHGEGVIRGLLLTNVLIHLGCCLLACGLLRAWIRSGPALLLGSLLFSAFWCHGEVLWYVAGRTDSLCALGFLSGLLLHVSGRDRPFLRLCALPFFAFSFLTKELAVAFPLVCFLHDLWVERREKGLLPLLLREKTLWISYAALALGIQGFRSLMLAGGATSLIFPYFVPPLDDRFPGHLHAQLRTYAENLLLAGTTKPFLQARDLSEWVTLPGLFVSLLALALFTGLLWRKRAFWLLLLLGLATWLPTCFVYVSERYLYLPSLAVAGSLGLLIERLSPNRHLFGAGLLVSLLWIGHQGAGLRWKNRTIAGMERAPQFLGRQIREVEPPLAGKGRLLILNLPGDFLQAQFMENQVRVQLRDPELELRVLSLLPIQISLGEEIRVRKVGTKSLVVRSSPGALTSDSPDLLNRKGSLFPWIPLVSGRRVRRRSLSFEVEILQGSRARCQAVRFTFRDPLSSYTLLRWRPHPDPGKPPRERIRLGRFERVF